MAMTKRDIKMVQDFIEVSFDKGMQTMEKRLADTVQDNIHKYVNGKVDAMRIDFVNYTKEDALWKGEDKKWKDNANNKLEYVGTLKIRISTMFFTALAVGGLAAFFANLTSIISIFHH